MTKRSTFIAALLLLAMFLAQAILSMRQKSPTFDEVGHLPVGYAYLRTGNFSLNPEQPPLVKLLAAAPLLLLKLNLPSAGPPSSEYQFGRQFLFRSGNDADLVLFLGRLPMVLLGAVLGWYVFSWSRALYGDKAGLLSLFFYVLCPNILAHTQLVTMDLAVGCFMLIACYYGWKYVRAPSLAGLVKTSVFTGFALAAKFSGLLLLPVLLLLVSYGLLAPGRPANSEKPLPARPVALLLVSFLMIAAVTLGLLFLVYGFAPDVFSLYGQGVRSIYQRGTPGYQFYLNGRFSGTGWWYYYLAAFLMKTPVPLLVLAALSFLGMRKRGLPDELWLVLPMAAVVGASFFDPANLGLRRILPAYPFLFVLIGRAAGPGEHPRLLPLRHALLALLCLWTVVNAVRIYPDHLTYFNEPAGGPRKGILHLDDSNIDWGQDLKGLGRYLNEHGIGQVRLLYFGTADPTYYGIRSAPPSEHELAVSPEPGAWYAVSAHMLVRLKLARIGRGYGIDWLEQFTPKAVIGNSIYLYRF